MLSLRNPHESAGNRWVSRYDDAHLVGNGRLGAAIYGGVPFEENLINDDPLRGGMSRLFLGRKRAGRAIFNNYVTQNRPTGRYANPFFRAILILCI